MTNETKNKPAFEARLNQIRVSVFRNSNDKGVWFNTGVSRRYRDDQGNWKDSNTLSGLGDIALAMEGLRLAREFISSQATPHSDEDTGGQP